MLLTHEALPIKLKQSGRNAKSRWSRIPDCQRRAQSLKATEPTGSLRSVIMPKILIGASILLLMLSAVFGVLNNGKVKGLRTEAENATKSREIAERARAAQQKNLQGREVGAATTKAKPTDIEARFASAANELTKSQTEKATLQSKLEARESEVAELKKRVEQTGPSSIPSGGPSTTELQAQLDETRKQLESAENEKALLSEKGRSGQERLPSTEVRRPQRSAATRHPGLHGTVLAVNQAYNFVVLNLGGRQGVETSAEMLVLRNGTLIGKIRVSSVEPATAIGDIISSTLTRGVQVQPGDNVIYAGRNL